ncbi:hypothetical protein EXIGLDRAFT_836182 [Exidia glandulosa HHB12029]|uniref:Uncharacterized protein n=1 Tax=Exidia glandulosa HHB12029 TaxID=1314781 RepID=A0A166AKK3_EXIGL|nr:hypothetical protein EXIGLDRAFT_836182 [Exidia glandulosa HHB12029]
MTADFTLDPDPALALTQHTAEIVLEGTRRLAAQPEYAYCGTSGRVPLPEFFDAVRRYFGETMRNMARASNMELFARNVHRRLPDEVWCGMVGLPFADRLRVTHVCRDGRRLVLSTPFIWCDVDIWVYRHEHSCKCDDCTLTPRLHPMISNARLVRYALALSQGMPLRVTLGDRGTVFELGSSAACKDAVQILVGALKLHAARVVSLHATLATPFLMPNFFQSVNAFPRLVDLSVSTTNSEALAVPLFNSRTVVSLPQLRTLRITDGWAHCWELGAQVFPVVTTLRVTFVWTNSTLALIRACPALECLELWVPKTITGRQPQRDEFIDAVAAIPHVRLLNMTDHYDTALALLVLNDARQNYECAYTEAPGYTMHFSALDDTESFFCSRQGDLIVLRAETSSRSGRKIRTFSFPYEEKVDMAPLWDIFEPVALKHITCDATLWYLVTARMPRFKYLKSLTLSFTESESFADYKSGLGDPPDIGEIYVASDDDSDDACYRFSALRTVTFCRSSGGKIEIPEWWCEAFLATLELDEEHDVKFKPEGVTLRYDSDYEADFLHPSESIPLRLMMPIIRRDCAPEDVEEDELEDGEEEVVYDHEGFASAYLSSLIQGNLAF